MILGLICTVLGITGVYGFISGGMALVLIGGIAGLVENLVGIMTGEQNNLVTATIGVIAGIIYSSSVRLPFWYGASVGLCFESAIMGIVGFLMLAAVRRKV